MTQKQNFEAETEFPGELRSQALSYVTRLLSWWWRCCVTIVMDKYDFKEKTWTKPADGQQIAMNIAYRFIGKTK